MYLNSKISIYKLVMKCYLNAHIERERGVLLKLKNENETKNQNVFEVIFLVINIKCNWNKTEIEMENEMKWNNNFRITDSISDTREIE